MKDAHRSHHGTLSFLTCTEHTMADEMSDRELNDLTDDCEQVSITSLWMNNEVWPGTTAVYEMDSNYPYV